MKESFHSFIIYDNLTSISEQNFMIIIRKIIYTFNNSKIFGELFFIKLIPSLIKMSLISTKIKRFLFVILYFLLIKFFAKAIWLFSKHLIKFKLV